MVSITATRLRLKELDKAARIADEAVNKIDEAREVLADQEEERCRREWDDDSDDSGDGENESEEDENIEAREEEGEEEEREENHSTEESRVNDLQTFQDVESSCSNEEELDYETKQKNLEEKKHKCMRETIDAYMTFVTEFEIFSKVEIRNSLKQLHNEMRSKLPMELREMIYSYLDIQGRAYYNDPTKHLPIVVGQGEFDPNFHNDEEIFLDEKLEEARKVFESGSFDSLKPGGWMLNPEYVGQDMAREIAEIFYSVNNFTMSLKDLKDFLLLDRTQTGMKPYEYIRRELSVIISTTRCNGNTERAWQTTQNEIEFLNGIYEQLKSLMLITRKSDVSIELWLITSQPGWDEYEAGERRFYNIMESVRAPVYDLIHAGVDITVTHNYMSNGCKLKISEGPLNFFSMSKEEWEEEKRKHSPDWMPSMNFITKEEIGDRTKKQRSMKRQLKKLLKQRWGHESYRILEG